MKKDEIIMVRNANGTLIDFEASEILMDYDLKEEIYFAIGGECTQQEFFTAYEKEHKKKFGEEWELSKDNPVW